METKKKALWTFSVLGNVAVVGIAVAVLVFAFKSVGKTSKLTKALSNKSDITPLLEDNRKSKQRVKFLESELKMQRSLVGSTGEQIIELLDYKSRVSDQLKGCSKPVKSFWAGDCKDVSERWYSATNTRPTPVWNFIYSGDKGRNSKYFFCKHILFSLGTKGK